MKRKRGLADQFMVDLKTGSLSPLLDRVRKDATLDLRIRENYINVYYRGGSLLKVSVPNQRNHPPNYLFEFNPDYTKYRDIPLMFPPSEVVEIDGCRKWLLLVPEIKDTMDLWFGKHPKVERTLQQAVVWENNDSPWANGTDYFIIDIEYDSRKGISNNMDGSGGRFDLVAIRWDSSSSSRALRGQLKARIAIIEMKTGDQALKGTAGLQEHVRVLESFGRDVSRKEEFIEEMLGVFNQLHQLGLIKCLSRRQSVGAEGPILKRQDVDNNLVYMLLLAGHDPASKKLKMELESLNTELPIQVCTANFTGFGLYKENIYPLPEFITRFQKQI